MGREVWKDTQSIDECRLNPVHERQTEQITGPSSCNGEELGCEICVVVSLDQRACPGVYRLPEPA